MYFKVQIYANQVQAMFFGARITFDKNPSFLGGFTLSVWRETQRLYIVYAEVPENILEDIYKRGGLIIKLGFVDEAFNDALLGWCIRETERRLRDGRFDEKPTGVIPIQVTAEDVPAIMFSYREKTCDYQRLVGRELFCSAAGRDDESVTSTEGAVRLAPTTRPLCRRCDLPDTNLICAHIAHPTVYGTFRDKRIPIVSQRLLAGAYCELDKNMNGVGIKCRAGGNDCWESTIEFAPDAPSVPYSPRELPTALDFLNVIWERVFKRPLYIKATFQKPASLSLPCASRDEFVARLGDLNELLRKTEIPDELLPDDNKSSGKQAIPEAEKLNRLSACLRKKLSSDEHGQIDTALEILKAINVVRNKLTHGGAELLGALRYLGIKYPIGDYAQTWDHIRSKAAEAVTILRSSLETL